MKYDLIIVGGGPAGLMAAKTAAEDGAKVLLIERRNVITETNRADTAIFYWKFLAVDGYIEPITVEIGTWESLKDIGSPAGKPVTKLHYLVPGFTFEYTGPVLPYYNIINFSPSGHQVYAFKDELWGFYYNRQQIHADLLSQVEKTKAEVLTGTMAIGVDNTSDGVKVRVRSKSGEQTLEARKAISAEGATSKTMECLGLYKDRPVFHPLRVVSYIMAGVEAEGVPDHNSWLTCSIPSMGGGGAIMMGIHSEAESANLRNVLGASEETIMNFMKHSRYAPWFRNARLVRKMSCSSFVRTNILREPSIGNILLLSDAAATEECWIQGAIACGYQGAKATLKELGGEKGYQEYTRWWQNAFSFFVNPDHFRSKLRHRLLKRICSDEEIDYLFRFFEGQVVHPLFVITAKPEMVKKERPELYEKLKKGITEINKELSRV